MVSNLFDVAFAEGGREVGEEGRKLENCALRMILWCSPREDGRRARRKIENRIVRDALFVAEGGWEVGEQEEWRSSGVLISGAC